MLFASALRETLAEGYGWSRLQADLVAGITLAIIALPLGMALAIATGVAPQYGIYTVIVGGLVIALTGGSRFNISGPTAAFVVILLPIVHKWGLGGLLLATLLSGVILLVMGLARMGRLVSYIPHPVVVGFTAGIGVVIASLQLRDFFGLSVAGEHEHFVDKMEAILVALPTLRWQETLVAVVTLAIMIGWPRLKTRIPAHLVALVAVTLLVPGLAVLLPDFEVATIGSRFTWTLGELSGSGVPPFAPTFLWPWELPAANGQPVGISFTLLRELLPAALAIALLGAIESLLCAVIADGLTSTRHNPNAELVGQGLGNIIAPFFGGITATAAIARTAANVRVGATSPVSAAVHALFVLLALVLLADVLAGVPMAALAALLVVVAWNMAEVPHFLRIVRVAPRSDVVVLLVCFALTVLFDMVLAVGVGMALAAVLFIHRMTGLTGVEKVDVGLATEAPGAVPDGVLLYDVNGPLFFGAAQQAMDSVVRVDGSVRVVVLDMRDVSIMDMTGIAALESALASLSARRLPVIMAGLSARIRRKLERAGIAGREGVIEYAATLPDALGRAATLVAR